MATKFVPGMKGELNYSEYICPCGGRTERRKVSTEDKGFFKHKWIFTYYYECCDCEMVSGDYEADITHRFV
jgi:hypothetical protein